MPSECHRVNDLMRLATKNHFQPVNPRDGNSPYKRQPISPPLSVARGVYPGPPYHHLPDAGRYPPNIHPPPPPPPPGSYGSSQLYRDGGLYQAAERLTVVDASGSGGDHQHSSQSQHQYREQNEHPQQAPQPGYQSQTVAAVAAAVAAARRRPSLLPTEYTNAINRDRERYLENYSSSYYERELNSANAAGVMPAHAYPMMVGPHGPPMDPSEHHLIVKRPRLTIMGGDQKQDAHRMLGIDTDMKREPAYNPQVEAISPTLPMDDYNQDSSPNRTSRDDLLQQISKVDREIAKVESQIVKLKKKQMELEMAAAEPENSKSETVDTSSQEATKHLSMAQIIYADNKKKSHEAHQILSKLGPKVDLPLYNQPFDTSCYHENKKKYLTFKKKLIAYFKKRQQDRQVREKYLADTYNQLLQQWQKKVERIENNVKKKGKELKIREFYEKQFPELKKQREDKERFSRVGTRIRSDAELEEIMDGLQEQELEDKKMRSYAVVPPILLDPRQKRLAFQNENSLVEEAMADYKERQLLNIWTNQEKDMFKERYLQHPKNFGLIASYLERKSVADCVQYYYLTKKNENYKQLLRKHSVRKKRFSKPNQAAAQPPSTQSGVMTRQGTSTGQSEDNSKALLSTTSTATSITNTNTTSTSSLTIATTTTSSGSFNGTVGASGSSSSCGGTTASSECPSVDTSKCDQKDQTQDGCDNSEKCDIKENVPIKEHKNDDTGDEQSDDNDGGSDVQGRVMSGPHTCAVCKATLDNSGMSRPLSKSNCQQYGLKEEEVTVDMRVCSFCHCRSVRSRYTHCPIISCRTPKRKVKRLRPLPGKWAELPPEIKDPIMKELQITPEVTKCCSACFNRITRKLGSHSTNNEINVASVLDGADNSRWNEEEIELAKRAIKEHGPNWFKVASVVTTKTEIQCKNFCLNFKKKVGLSASSGDTYGEDNELGDKAPPTVTDEEESGESTSSCDDFNGPYQDGSDTASAPSPNSKAFDEDSKKGFKDPSSTPKKQLEPAILPGNYIDEAESLQECKDLSASRGSLNSVKDYDSSATVSADEGPNQMDTEPVSISTKGDQRHSSNGSREDSNSQSSAPSFLDETRVKVLLTQAAASRTDNQATSLMLRMDADNSTKGPERSELDSGEHIFTKTVRDLIDQAIDTSFPDGTSNNGSQPTAQTAGIPNIQDILKRSMKPAGMLKLKTKDYNRESIEMINPASQQLPSSSTVNSQIHPDSVNLRPTQPPHLHQHQPHMRPIHPPLQQQNQFIHQQQAPPPPPIPSQQNLISHHLSSQNSSGQHPSIQQSSRIHHGYSHPPSGASSGQSVLVARESLPTVNLYVPDDLEQVKAEDLSIKKDRSRDIQAEYNMSSSSFRSPPIVQKGSVELRHAVAQSPTQSQSSPHLGHHGERPLGVPPPAHCNQYSRANDLPHMGDTYYNMRQIEQRTKSPSTFPPERLSQSQHIPPTQPPLSSQQQCPRPMSPHASYISMGCSPPLKGQNLKGSNGGNALPPPLVSSSKHNTSSPKMAMKQDKMSSSGSITQGTPVNQSNMLSSGGHLCMPSHPGGRYEEYNMHHGKEVGGSITLGTPVQHEGAVNKRSLEQSPSTPQVPGMMGEQNPRGVLMTADGMKAPLPHGYDPYFHRRASPPAVYSYSNFSQFPRPPFATESQISSRQTIMTDYYLSQQMQLRRNSGGEKDKEARMSPRMPRDCSPQNASVLVDHRMHPMYPYPSQPGIPPAAYMDRLSQQQQQQRHPVSPIHEGHEPPQMSHSISPSGGLPPPLWSRGTNHSPTMATPPPVLQQQQQQQQRGVIRSTISCNPSNLSKGKPVSGVIQSPKASSPRTLEIDTYGPPKTPSSARHTYVHGHDAFGALVDVAIAQALPKDVTKHHPNSPVHISSGGPPGSIHELRNIMPNMRDNMRENMRDNMRENMRDNMRENMRDNIRENMRDNMRENMRDEKINSTHKNNMYYDDRRGIPAAQSSSLPQPIKERHKYELVQKIEPINDDRGRKMVGGGMMQADDGSPASHHGGQLFMRPEYNRMDADRMRTMHRGQPMQQIPLTAQHQGIPSQNRDNHPIEVDDGPTPSSHHHLHRGSPHQQLSAHRGAPPPLSSLSSDQRRPSPPQDLSSDSRRSTHESYSSYTNRNNSSVNIRQLERDPSKILFDALEKDQPKEASSSGEKQTFTAANLIDAIISHQINKVTTSPSSKRRPGMSSMDSSNSSTKNYRISPDASNMSAEGRMSPYKLQRVPNYSNAVSKPKEELVVTLDDSPMAADRDHDVQPQQQQLPPTSLSSSHSAANATAVLRGTSPGSPFINSERPTSRGRTPQPSSSPAAGMPTHSPGGLKFTLKEHIDAIITNDYQADSAHSHYNRNADSRPPSGSDGSAQAVAHPPPPRPPSQSNRAYLGVPEVPEISSPNVQPSTRSVSPDDQMTVYPNWKLRKALQQSKEHQREMQQEQRKSPTESSRARTTPTSVSPLPARTKGGLLAPDERQIIRIVQSASPRPSDMSSKGSVSSVSPLMGHPPTSQQQQQQSSSSIANYQVEPISPPSNFGPDSNLGEASSTTNIAPGQSSSSSWITSPNITSLLTTRRMYQPPDSSDATTPQSGLNRPHQTGLSPFEKYVKHKIVEEMRKSSDETSGEAAQDGRGGQPQPPSNSPRVDERNNAWPVEREQHPPQPGMKYRGSEINESVAVMFPGPASQYVPGAIYHPSVHHQVESASSASSSTMGPTSSSRGIDIPRPKFKRTFEVMEAVGSSERSGPGSSTSGGNTRSRSISPSSSDIGAREVEDIKRKRYRLGDSSVNSGGGHSTPESSTEWSHQMLVPESSEGMSSHRGGSSSHAGVGGAREPQQPSSSDHQANVGSGSLPSSSGTPSGGVLRTGFSSSTSSPEHPQPSRKEIEEEGEAQSTGTGLGGSSSRLSGGHHGGSKANSLYEGKPGSSMWDNEVTSGKDDKGSMQMADSPLSGDMVIDESPAIDSATSSKLEPVSPPPQEGISTSEQDDSYTLVSGVSRLTSSSNSSSHVTSDPGHSVTSSHGVETRTSPVGGPSSNSNSGSASNSNGGNVAGSSSSSAGVTVGSSYPNPISSTVSNPNSYPNSSAIVNNISGVSTTYTYPFSALSVRSLAAAVNSSPSSPSTVVGTPSSSSGQQQPNQSLSSSTSRSNSPVSASREVPSLLMSSQYEPLSDED